MTTLSCATACALFQQHVELPGGCEAENGAQLPAQLPSTPCDVVLLDLHLPGLSGLATTQRLRAEFPEVRVLRLPASGSYAPSWG